MLVLGRKEKETICIYPEGMFGHEESMMEFKIIYIKENFVKIGVTAPSNMVVHRKEIYEKLLKEKK
jgi:carbon storage regulator CsrA